MVGNITGCEKKYKLLNHEETIQLLKKAQNGDKQAKDKLVEYNLGLVLSIIKKFQNRGYERDAVSYTHLNNRILI